MTGLAEFLLARIAEDEAWWHARHEVDPQVPRRMLAECEAKRRIVAWCGERERIHVPVFASDADAARASEFVPGGLSHPADSVVLRLLALPYADHPDYRPEWADIGPDSRVSP